MAEEKQLRELREEDLQGGGMLPRFHKRLTKKQLKALRGGGGDDSGSSSSSESSSSMSAPGTDQGTFGGHDGADCPPNCGGF